MRSRPASSALVTVVVAVALTASPFAHAQEPESAEPVSDDQADARAAYEAGETAYRLGRFDDAAREFERAYELSGLPAFLFNIGLAHLRWYDIDPDIAHLRKAKVVIENYQLELQKDPELGDPEEAKTVLVEIEGKLASHQTTPDEPEVPVDVVPDEDPGKKLQLGGAVTMGVGGLLIVGGVVAGVVMALRSKEFTEELNKTYAAQQEFGCPADTETCMILAARAETASHNGRQANTLAVGLGLGLGGAGLIALVAGAVVFARGAKQTREWKQQRVGFVPVWMPGGGGLTVAGRF